MLGTDEIWGSLSPTQPYHSLIRFLGTLTKVKAEYLLISWGTGQVKLTEGLSPVTVISIIIVAVEKIGGLLLNPFAFK